MITPSFAQTEYEPGLTVITDKSSYDQGNNIKISGKVSQVIPDALITIQLWKDGDIVNTDKLEPNNDGTYSHALNARGPIWTQGTYVIKAIYGDQDTAQTMFKLGNFKPTEKSNSFNPDSSETKISVKMNGDNKFYLTSPNQVIRATVEIQNYSPTDGNYYVKVTHIPTKKILKDFEIMFRYSGNDLWHSQIAYPLFGKDLKVLDQTLIGKYLIQISSLNGAKTASTQFSILTSQYESSIPEPKPETTPEITSDTTSLLPSEINIDVSTDKSFYRHGETITVTGDVSEVFFGYALGITIVSSNGNNELVDQVLPNPDGSFSYNFDTGKNLLKNYGNYKIHLIYGTEDLSKDVFFLFSNSTVILPESILDPESVLDVKSPSESEKPIFPEWTKNVMQWYLDGVISENELALNFKYLVNEGVVKLI